MPKFYEFQGKSVDQALEKASDELNIPAEKIKHEVLAYGSSGIFGLVGIKKAKIKVVVDEQKTKKNRALTTEETSNVVQIPKRTDEDRSPEAVKTIQFDEELVTYGKLALQKIVDGITTDARIEHEQRDDVLLFSISGGESGVLIGKRGQTLEAIQYLLEKMINKKSINRLRIMVDVEGYLEKRKTNLQQMATRMAEKARRTNKPVTIGQMNAHDRRIVHIHLKDTNGIRTQSIGSGYYRKLMIFPKKPTGTKNKNSNP
jgi:spoIIIJ-associated protein